MASNIVLDIKLDEYPSDVKLNLDTFKRQNNQQKTIETRRKAYEKCAGIECMKTQREKIIDICCL